MDNLSVHKRENVRALIEAMGCSVVFLPSYSPDFNPIEHAFFKLKGILRRTQARTYDALQTAIGKALESITQQDAGGYFRHCGYLSYGSIPP